MSGGTVADYACPDCGYDGPHYVHSDDGDVLVVECGDTECAAEFEITDFAAA